MNAINGSTLGQFNAPRRVDGLDVSKISGVVLPERPVFDKIIAFFLFLAFGLRMGTDEIAALNLDKESEGVDKGELGLSFWGGARVYRGRIPQGKRFAAGGNRPTEAQQNRWRRDGAYTIDVGDNKYQERGTASAAECVALDCGLIQKWGLERLFHATHEWISGTDRAKQRARRGFVWDARGKCEVSAHQVVNQCVSDVRERVALHYVLLASRNNGTGYLKESPYSVVYLLRELQKPDVLSEDDGWSSWTNWTIPGIIRWVLDVIVADYQVRVGLEENTLERKSVALLKASDVGELFSNKELGGEQFCDFNLASYFRNLMDLGVPEAEIGAIANRIHEDVIGQVSIQKEKARECLDRVEKETFGGGLGMMLISADPAIADNTRVTREMWKAFPLVRIAVVINSREQVSILSDGSVPLDAAARMLQELEPNRWFYDPRIGAILNGGHSFTKVPSTKIAFSKIICLLEAVVYKTH